MIRRVTRPSTGKRTPAELVEELNAKIKHPESSIWKGYATRYLKESQAWQGVLVVDTGACIDESEVLAWVENMIELHRSQEVA